MDADQLNTKTRLAAQRVPEMIDNYINGNLHAAAEQLTALLGRDYTDVPSALIAMCEYAGTAAGVEPVGDNPTHGYTMRIIGPDGRTADPAKERPERLWATRFMVAVWNNDAQQIGALFHVFTDGMPQDDPDDKNQAQAIRALLTAVSQTVQAAQQKGTGA